MITFYIDDSGSKEVNDSSQPIFLFSGIAIPNEKFIEVNGFIEKKIRETSRLIMDKLVSCSRPDVSDDDIKHLLKQYLFRDFELHATEFMHGKDEYICLSKSEKINILTSVFEFIKEKEIKVIVIKCEKKDILNNQAINNKDKQKSLNNKMIDKIFYAYEKFLEDNDEQGVLVFDEGNDLISSIFKEKAKTRNSSRNRISPYIAESKSCNTPLIQIADFVAYVCNATFNPKSKFNSDLKPFYNLIIENIILYDINQ